MEKELNIAAILKDKPDVKLWSPAIGECSFRSITMEGFIMVKADSVINYWFGTDGKLYNEGECLLFPSKQMRDWSKFAWKKGDVLASNNVICVFGGFRNDDYTKFNALNAICISPYDNKNEAICSTADFSKVQSEEDIKNYLLNSQVIFGNIKLPACDIEQPKPEFKDGDIVYLNTKNGLQYVFAYDANKEMITSYIVAYCITLEEFAHIETQYICRDNMISIIHLATVSEKQQLFDALAKENKAWDAEKKAIVDLQKKCEFKAFDFVLVNDKGKDSLWFMYQFAFEFNKKGYKYYCMIGGRILEANLYNFLPYNDSTKHLLGTTDEWKGGEG